MLIRLLFPFILFIYLFIYLFIIIIIIIILNAWENRGMVKT